MFNPVHMLALLPEPLISTDTTGRILFLNRAAERVTGYDTASLLGQSFTVLIAPSDRRRTLRHFVKQERRELPESYRRVALMTRDGRAAWFGVRAARIKGAGGASHYVACAQDLHDAHAEIELLKRKLKEQAARADEAVQGAKAKGDLVATLSHEFRTPMNGIIGMTRLLLDSKLDRDQRSFVTSIAQSSESLVVLINESLDFSKIEAGKLDLEQLDFDLRVSLDAVTAILAPRAQEKGIELVCSVHHEVPSSLRGDASRLRQVLLNLAGNAVKFTEQGEVTIRAELVKDEVEHVTLRFSVTDTGIGIDREHQGKLFELYSQADASISKRFGGTGLGLAISRKLVNLMGGEVGVISEPGEGSTFWAEIPFEKRIQGDAAVLPQVELAGLRVLIADPAQNMRTALGEMLSNWGCESTEAEDGQSALAILREGQRRDTPYKVVIVDMQLPELDAEGLAKAINADKSIERPLLMLLTNLGRRGDAARAKEWGYSAYLLKPVQQSHFYDALVEMVHESGKGKVQVATQPLITRHSLAEKKRQRTRVLLVEDNPVNQLVAVAALRRMGCQTEVVANGAAAVEAVGKGEAFDVIFMDVQMPDMDGFEATAAIRKKEKNGRRTPIVAVTAHADDGDRRKCLAAGMDDYLTKPIDLDVMCAMVDKWTRMDDAGRDALVRSQADQVNPPMPERMAKVVPMKHEDPVIDEARLEMSSMGSEELKGILMNAFIKNARPRLAKLRDHADRGDADGVQFEAHALKGMCATLGADLCTKLFEKIEHLAREGGLEPAVALVEAADHEVQRVEAAIAPRMKAA